MADSKGVSCLLTLRDRKGGSIDPSCCSLGSCIYGKSGRPFYAGC
jgi:hypothetical protein